MEKCCGRIKEKKMQTVNKGGDVLARGATRNTFPPAGGNVSDEKWNEMWGDFDPEAYKKAPNPAQMKTEGSESEVTVVGLPR
jgi:hypothetical protein